MSATTKVTAGAPSPRPLPPSARCTSARQATARAPPSRRPTRGWWTPPSRPAATPPPAPTPTSTMPTTQHWAASPSPLAPLVQSAPWRAIGLPCLLLSRGRRQHGSSALRGKQEVLCTGPHTLPPERRQGDLPSAGHSALRHDGVAAPDPSERARQTSQILPLSKCGSHSQGEAPWPASVLWCLPLAEPPTLWRPPQAEEAWPWSPRCLHPSYTADTIAQPFPSLCPNLAFGLVEMGVDLELHVPSTPSLHPYSQSPPRGFWWPFTVALTPSAPEIVPSSCGCLPSSAPWCSRTHYPGVLGQ